MSNIRKFLIAFSLLLLGFSLVGIAINLWDDYNSQIQTQKLAELFNNSPRLEQTNEKIQIISPNIEGAILPEFQYLYEQNSDIVGWLNISGTQIDYPVMQNLQDAEYYLYRDFQGKDNKNGLPFLGITCQIDDANILLIHGHNMKSGLMFADLIKYKEIEYYREHPTIQFHTLYEKADYEIIAVILSKAYPKSENVFKYYQLDKIDTVEEFEGYVQNIKDLALYNTGISANYGDKLIILSTCEYSNENGRLAVIARKK